jgi:hypothetical protein
MLVLFDQGTPLGIRFSLPEHTVKTAREQEWSTLLNGELLRAAEDAGFDVLLTTDKNLPYQQNLKGRKLAVAVAMEVLSVHQVGKSPVIVTRCPLQELTA